MCFEMENIWSFFVAFNNLSEGIFNVPKQLGHTLCIMNSTPIEGSRLLHRPETPFFSSCSCCLFISIAFYYGHSFLIGNYSSGYRNNLSLNKAKFFLKDANGSYLLYGL